MDFPKDYQETPDKPFVLRKAVDSIIDLKQKAQRYFDQAHLAIHPQKMWERSAAQAHEGLLQLKTLEMEGHHLHSFDSLHNELVSIGVACEARSRFYRLFAESFETQQEKSGADKPTLLFSIWDRDITGISEETIRGKAFGLSLIGQNTLKNASVEAISYWVMVAHERERVRRLQEAYRRDKLRISFEKDYPQALSENRDVAWRRVATERFESSESEDLKAFMFEHYFDQFEETIQSMEQPFPKLPELYETEGMPENDKMIPLHLFFRDSHWYIAEYDPQKRLFFGFTVLNDDWQMAEWGYISQEELQSFGFHGLRVEQDLSWEPKKFGEIPKSL